MAVEALLNLFLTKSCPEILDKSSEGLVALHPMPMNVGIEISEKASTHGKFKYREQLSFGVPSRIASYMYVMENYD